MNISSSSLQGSQNDFKGSLMKISSLLQQHSLYRLDHNTGVLMGRRREKEYSMLLEVHYLPPVPNKDWEADGIIHHPNNIWCTSGNVNSEQMPEYAMAEPNLLPLLLGESNLLSGVASSTRIPKTRLWRARSRPCLCQWNTARQKLCSTEFC